MKKILIIFMVIMLVFQIGCGESNRQIAEEDDIQEELVIPTDTGEQTIVRRSEDLSNMVVDLFGIDDTTTIIFNDMAVMAVVMAYDSELNQDIVEAIEELVISNDEEIRDIIVTDDKKIFLEIDNIVLDLLNGKSYDSYVGKINKIIDKINKEKKPIR